MINPLVAQLRPHRASQIYLALLWSTDGSATRRELENALGKIDRGTLTEGLKLLARLGLVAISGKLNPIIELTDAGKIPILSLEMREKSPSGNEMGKKPASGEMRDGEKTSNDAGKIPILSLEMGKKPASPYTRTRTRDLVVVNDPDLTDTEDNNNKPPPHPDRRAQFERDHVGDQTAIWQMLKDAGITSMSVKMAEILDMRLDERYVRAWCAHASETGMEPNVLIIRLLAGAESPPICPECERSICQCRFRQPREELVITPLSEAASHWRDTLVELELQLTRATFSQWLKGSECLGREGSCYVVRVASDSAREWLEVRLIDVILKTLRCVSNDAVAEVRFEVCDEAP